MSAEQRPRAAMIFSGGGALGAYEVGVLKALVSGLAPGQERVDPAILSGTSVGAFNAAFLAAQASVPLAQAVVRLEEVWLNRIADRGRGNGVFRYRLDPRRWAVPFPWLREPQRTWTDFATDVRTLSSVALREASSWWSVRHQSLFNRLSRLVVLSSLVSTSPMLETIRTTIDFGCLRSSHRELRIAVTNWNLAVPEVFSQRELDAGTGPNLVRASASLPGFFPPVRIGSHTYVDGGVMANTPLAPAIRAGAKVIHLVGLYPLVQHYRGVPDTVSALYRSLVMSWGSEVYSGIRDVEFVNRLAEAGLGKSIGKGRPGVEVDLPPQGKIAIHFYYPLRDLGEGPFAILDFRYEKIRYLIERGYQDTRENPCTTVACGAPQWFGGSLFNRYDPNEVFRPEVFLRHRGAGGRPS